MPTGVTLTSPVMADRPDRISFRNPEDTATAIIITRKLTAMDTIAIFPLKRNRPAMKNEASIPLFLCVQCIQTTFGQHLILF